MGSKRSKIIFLDIDGVLNCNKTPKPHDLPYVVDKRLLRVLIAWWLAPARRSFSSLIGDTIRPVYLVHGSKG